MKNVTLPHDYALVLQMVNESGEEDIETLSELLRVDRKRLMHIIQSLHHKGLIYFNSKYQYSMIRLSSKGRQLVRYIWPESQPGMMAA